MLDPAQASAAGDLGFAALASVERADAQAGTITRTDARAGGRFGQVAKVLRQPIALVTGLVQRNSELTLAEHEVAGVPSGSSVPVPAPSPPPPSSEVESSSVPSSASSTWPPQPKSSVREATLTQVPRARTTFISWLVARASRPSLRLEQGVALTCTHERDAPPGAATKAMAE
jgi:hypothetical protein